MSSGPEVYNTDVGFTVNFNAAKVALWWTAWIGVVAYGVVKGLHRAASSHSELHGWPLYWMFLGHLTTAAVHTTMSLTYAVHYQLHGVASRGLYRALITFSNLSTATFLALLLLLASGYGITRAKLGRPAGLVVVIPLAILVSGLVTDFIFMYVQETQLLVVSEDRYDLSTMAAWQRAVWALGSLAYLAMLLLAWLAVFNGVQQELENLEAAHERLQAPTSPTGTNTTPASTPSTATTSTTDMRTRLIPPGGNVSHLYYRDQLRSPPSSASPPGLQMRPLPDLEAGQSPSTGQDAVGAGAGDSGRPGRSSAVKETFADRVAYTLQKQLLTRFYWGVSTYLLAYILVVLLPLFWVDVVQNLLVVLLFGVQYCFTLVLFYIFRPQERSPYLMVGEGARGMPDVAHLDTELAVTHHQNGDSHTPAAGTHTASATTAGAASTTGRAAGQAVAGHPASPGDTEELYHLRDRHKKTWQTSNSQQGQQQLLPTAPADLGPPLQPAAGPVIPRYRSSWAMGAADDGRGGYPTTAGGAGDANLGIGNDGGITGNGNNMPSTAHPGSITPQLSSNSTAAYTNQQAIGSITASSRGVTTPPLPRSVSAVEPRGNELPPPFPGVLWRMEGHSEPAARHVLRSSSHSYRDWDVDLSPDTARPPSSSSSTALVGRKSHPGTGGASASAIAGGAGGAGASGGAGAGLRLAGAEGGGGSFGGIDNVGVYQAVQRGSTGTRSQPDLTRASDRRFTLEEEEEEGQHQHGSAAGRPRG